MKEILVVGRPNTGKTLFTLKFASFLGAKSLDITSRTCDGLLTCKHYSIDNAIKELSSFAIHKTRFLHSITIDTKIGKASVAFKMTDTCGLTDFIHDEQDIRKGMAQTLGLMRVADFIFHIIDASIVTRYYATNIANIDYEIYQYGLAKNNYLLIANKIDLPSAKENLNRINNIFPQTKVLPVSALHQTGFKEVRAYVARNV